MLLFAFSLLGCAPEKITVGSTGSTTSEQQNTSGTDTDTDESSEPADEETETQEETNTDTETSSECADPEGSQNADPNSLVGRYECGEQVYFTACAGCHGTEGQGGSAPALRGMIGQLQDGYITESILGGQGMMPPINITPQQVADVLTYMRDEFEPD